MLAYIHHSFQRNAPYFASITPRIAQLSAGFCEVRLTKRRAVQNHIGTVHAIAMCSMAELAAGLAMQGGLPSTHRWIPKNMQVTYLKKAHTHLIASAQLPELLDLTEPLDIAVPVAVSNVLGEPVFSAVVTMRVSPK